MQLPAQVLHMGIFHDKSQSVRCQGTVTVMNTHCGTLHEVWSGTLVYEHSLHYCSLSTATRLSSVHTAAVKLATWSTRHTGEPCWCCTVDRAVRHRWPSSSRSMQGRCQPRFQGLLQRPCLRRGCSCAHCHCIPLLSSGSCCTPCSTRWDRCTEQGQ